MSVSAAGQRSDSGEAECGDRGVTWTSASCLFKVGVFLPITTGTFFNTSL